MPDEDRLWRSGSCAARAASALAGRRPGLPCACDGKGGALEAALAWPGGEAGYADLSGGRAAAAVGIAARSTSEPAGCRWRSREGSRWRLAGTSPWRRPTPSRRSAAAGYPFSSPPRAGWRARGSPRPRWRPPRGLPSAFTGRSCGRAAPARRRALPWCAAPVRRRRQIGFDLAGPVPSAPAAAS